MNEQTKAIPLTPCDSSQIHAYGYDGETNTLALQFKKSVDINGVRTRVGGSVYHYANFTTDELQSFLEAPSKGLWFSAHLKNATAAHPFTKQPDIAP